LESPVFANRSTADNVRQESEVNRHESAAITRLAAATLSVLIVSVPVHALGQNEPEVSFLRTHFVTDDGLPGSVVDDAVQTPDGFLWLVADGQDLVRFDGKRFHRFEKVAARRLAVAPNGDLLVGTLNGLIRIPSSSFNQSTLSGLAIQRPGPDKASLITTLRIIRNGELLVGTENGLFRYEQDRFVAVVPSASIRRVEEAPDGHLLITTGTGFMELAGVEVVPHPGLSDRLGVKDNEIFQVLKDRRNNTWYATSKGVARETSGRIEKLGTYAQFAWPVVLYEDGQGAVWLGKQGGLYRATATRLELVDADLQVRSLYGDRDGNLWVGSNGDALFRFKPSPVLVFTTRDGLPGDVIMTVLAAHDGAVWTGANCGGLTRFDGRRFQTYNESAGLANTCVWALAEDSKHALWIGTWGGGAFRFHDGKFTQYSTTQGMVSTIITSIVVARDGTLWFGSRDGGVSRLRNGQFRNYTTANGLSSTHVLRVFEDRAGVVWVGTREGLYRIVGERAEAFSSVPTEYVHPLGQDRQGGLLFNISKTTVLRLDSGRTDAITGLPDPWDVIETAQGELWFGGRAFSRVQPGVLAQRLSRDGPLDHELFSVADGLATAQASTGVPSLALTPDGKVWAATGKGLAQFDPRRLPSTNAKPTIYLTGITVGRDAAPTGHELSLPPGTNHVEIDFAAIEISSPEKIHLQYRLDDVDSEWLDASSDARAIYTQVPVGTHALHVRACNRNGIWDRQGVAISITQQPHFYQTRPFVAATLVLGLLLVGGIHRLRVRQISRTMTARFDERLDERTRVARDLHDTFLQTVQASKMVAEHALKDSADHSRMVRAMDQLSTWLGQATEEGRAALNSLRASTNETNDLAEALRRAIDECRQGSQAEMSVSVNGDVREMHPVVRDEVYRIGYEAIRNACTHSGGDRLEVSLDYGHDLTLRIRDNGVGIDPSVVEKGRDGHFGLPGIRERSERIRGRFTVVSAPSSGTVIMLVVPGLTAFRTRRRTH
jgi:signal transduction histidine kinase/ligand-binding sensor domain-containing protein